MWHSTELYVNIKILQENAVSIFTVHLNRPYNHPIHFDPEDGGNVFLQSIDNHLQY
jgi:hypothetical protein